MEKPVAMFKNLCKEIKPEFIRDKLNSEEKAKEQQLNINNIELWDMRYMEKYILEFSQYYYKLSIMTPTFVCFMTNYHIQLIL